MPPRFGFRAALPRIAAVLLFGLAMAYMEAAAVLYLRTIYGGVDPVGPRSTAFQPLPDFGFIEIGREASTMAMLACVGWLAGPAGARFWAFLVAFGVWDLGYYAFLWLFTGWPGSLFAPDVLFLIPLPWWGPVLSPALIAVLMVGCGALAMARQAGSGLPRLGPRALVPLAAGAALCLVAFMWGALAELPRGLAAAFDARAWAFPWTVYLCGLALLGLGAAGAVLGGGSRLAEGGEAYEAASSVSKA